MVNKTILQNNLCFAVLSFGYDLNNSFLYEYLNQWCLHLAIISEIFEVYQYYQLARSAICVKDKNCDMKQIISRRFNDCHIRLNHCHECINHVIHIHWNKHILDMYLKKLIPNCYKVQYGNIGIKIWSDIIIGLKKTSQNYNYNKAWIVYLSVLNFLFGLELKAVIFDFWNKILSSLLTLNLIGQQKRNSLTSYKLHLTVRFDSHVELQM